MTWIPSINYVILLFNDQIKNASLMNRSGLISTLDKVIWDIPSQGTPTIWDQVTILFKDIVEGHFFSDGNKRIGILIANIFLQKNGYSFDPPKGELYSMTMDVAQGLVPYKQIKEWFVNSTTKT